MQILEEKVTFSKSRNRTPLHDEGEDLVKAPAQLSFSPPKSFYNDKPFEKYISRTQSF